MYLKNDLFVTAGEVEAKGFITIAGRVSRKYYEEKFYGMAQAN